MGGKSEEIYDPEACLSLKLASLLE